MKTILKDILVPIDFSDTSLNALNTAIKMAQRHDATLHLLYVNDMMSYYPLVGNLAAIQPMADEISKKDSSLLEKLAFSIITNHYVDCRFYTVSGNRNVIVKDWVNQHPIDLAIIGMQPGMEDSLYLFDSLAYQLLRSSSCHVLTVPAAKTIKGFHHIIYPVQSTGVPMSKYPLTRQIAEKNHADVFVVSMMDKTDTNMLGILNRFTERIKFRLAGKVKSVEIQQCFTKDAAKSLTEICRNEVADLIVIEADTHRNVKEFFFGNFTQKMLRNPEAAVLCINPKKKEVFYDPYFGKVDSSKFQMN